MNNHLLEEALQHVPNQQVLVNIVSKRVRQLNQGSRPLVDAPMRAGFADIALQEVVEGKLAFTLPAAADDSDAV
jgi:DNA-directed RNA polymerase subunit omega